MADVQITWNLGTDLGNITSTVVHKKASFGNSSNDCAQLGALALAGDAGSLVHEDAPLSGPPTDTSFVDVGVGSGTWVYGVFAKNAAGVNPCDHSAGGSLATITI